MLPLPIGCLVIGVIVLSLAYGSGIVIILVASIFDLNRLILTKTLYLGDAPIEYFWSPKSRLEFLEWNQKNKLAAIKRKRIDPLIESQDTEGLLFILRTGSFPEKTVAAEALGTLGDRRSVETLISNLQHNSKNLSAYSVAPRLPMRVAAASALGQLGDRQAVEPLIAVLENQGVAATVAIFMHPVQIAAATALGKLGDARALEPLTNALKSNNEDLKSAAMVALEQIEPVEGIQFESSLKQDLRQLTLTVEEKHVLKLLAKGRSNLEIANELNISPVQASLVKSGLLEKFEANNNGELLKKAQELSILPPN